MRTGGGSGVTDLARALAEATGYEIEAAVDRLEGADDETKKQLRKEPQIAAILARLRKERADAKAKETAKLAKEADGKSLADFMQG